MYHNRKLSENYDIISITEENVNKASKKRAVFL